MKSAQEPHPSKPCVLYVDTDNQRYSLAAPLLAELADRGLEPRLALLFGNNSGWSLTQWHATLLQVPALTRSVRAFPVPPQKQAADAALILALGQNLREHLIASESVVIVSRDQALVACAEGLGRQGVACLLACADNQPPPQTRAPVLVLRCQSDARPAGALPGLVVQQLREQLRPTPTGGYLKSAVGNALKDAGMDRAARAAFLAKLPGLREQLVDGEHVLYF